MTISAILVAWSATRSMKREMRMRRMARGMVLGSSIMKVRSSRKSCSLSASTSASSAHTLRASAVSRATKPVLDHLGRPRLQVEDGGSLMPSLLHAPAVGDALAGDEAAGQEKAPPVRLALARHHGLEAGPTALGRQTLRVLHQPIPDTTVPQAALHHEFLDGAEPSLQPQDRTSG